MKLDQQNIVYIAIFIQFLVALGFIVVSIVLTHLLGPKRSTKEKLDNFECGIEIQGSSRLPFSIKYFMTAILFVLFDVEVIFMYPWAVNFRELGMQGFLAMLLFMSTIAVGFIYIVKKGALIWD